MPRPFRYTYTPYKSPYAPPVTISRREPRPPDATRAGISPAFKAKWTSDCPDCGKPVQRGSIARFRRVARGQDLVVHASCVSAEEWSTLYGGSGRTVGGALLPSRHV